MVGQGARGGAESTPAVNVGGPLAGVGGGAAGEPPIGSRTDTLLADGWRFLRADAAGAESPSFDDSAWAPASVPHTWNALDGQDGGGDYYRGVGWYRRSFGVDAALGERRVYVQFDAANAVADVYVNGVFIGAHRGGFSRFRFDVTAALSPGENLIAVKVDNSAVADVPPLQADFTFFGGLYRDVHLLVTDPVHIDVEDFGSSGVYLRANDVSSTAATLNARIRVKNSAPQALPADVALIVFDAGSSEVARFEASASIAAGETTELVLGGVIQNPRLWDGVADPHLYTARVEVRREGLVVDGVTETFGVRSFSIDPIVGSMLNGRAVDVYGVNRHQDRIDRGWAVGRAEHDEDMAMIREIGATAVRLAHYQHDQYFYDLCDRAGLLVWAEIPLVDAIDNSPAFTDNARQQLTELIRQSYNHPAIVLWGIGNEQRADDAPTNALLADLGALAAREDDSRLSTYAHCCGADTSALTTHADVVGYNYYFGWYMGSHEQVGAWADALHQAQPSLRFSLSEYGAGASIAQHQDPPVQPVTTAPFHPEEYQTALHESTWQQLASRPYIWGKFIWNMFDFASDGRNEGDAAGRNDKGLVTFDRQVRKDAFFWYKANWSSEPLVYITSRRFNPRTTPTIDVKVYSNLQSVTLSVNGTAVSTQSSGNRIFSFPAVPLQLGENTVEATGSGDGGGVTVSDTVSWTRE